MIATVIIPVGPRHAGREGDAVSSARNQTVPVDVVVVNDTAGRGAAWARNEGVRRMGDTPFIIFLDADDTLSPTFVADTLKAYRRGCYVYTDFSIDGVLQPVPPTLDTVRAGLQHVITTLLPAAAFLPFDERLNALEDEDFYLNIQHHGWRWQHVPKPLVDYRRRLGHGRVNRERVDVDVIERRVILAQAHTAQKYARFALTMCDCKPPYDATPPTPERRANDVLAECLYEPHIASGPITQRAYPRAGKVGHKAGDVLWVDRDDAEARPDMWRIIAPNPQGRGPSVDEVWRIVADSYAALPTPQLKAIAKRNGVSGRTRDDVLKALTNGR